MQNDNRLLWFVSALLATVLLHIIAFVFATVYQLQRIADLETSFLQSQNVNPDSVSGLFSSRLVARQTISNPGDVEQEIDQIIKELVSKQENLIKETCAQQTSAEIKAIFTEFNEFSNTINHGNVKYRRQGTNEMAQLFEEIANSELAVLEKFCQNSTVCLPGPIGPKGSLGLSGSKGEPGNAGLKGDAGSNGLPGVRGLKGDPGTPGQPGSKGEAGVQGLTGSVGPQGPDGAKGEPGLRQAIPAAAPPSCCEALAKPGFPNNKEIIRVIEGTPVVLRCDVIGLPTPKVDWSPDVARITHNRAQSQGNDIIIASTVAGDSGTYTCKGSNVLGEANKVITLDVYKHISVTEKPQDHTLLPGQSVTFECKFSANPPATITWFHQDQNGVSSQVTAGIRPIVNGSQLTIMHANNADVGQYVCHATNGLESKESTASLLLQGPPKIIPLPSRPALVGETIRLTCNTQGAPKPNITWLSPPGANNAYDDKDGTLVLINVSKLDAGRYNCIATNQFGSAQSTQTLTVKEPTHAAITTPLIAVNPQTTNFAIDCHATGDPPLSVTWYHGGQPIIPDGAHIITPTNTLLFLGIRKPQDMGEYMCIVNDQFTSSNATATVYENKGIVSCGQAFTTCESICGVTCPANCLQDPSQVYGTTQYDMQSSVCKTGIHSGAMPATGGVFTWTTTARSQQQYIGSAQHSIVSSGLQLPSSSLNAVPINHK